MIRRVVREGVVLASALVLMGTSCPERRGPAGLIAAGDYRLVRATPDKTWEIPVSRSSQLGCGQLTGAHLQIDERGHVRHTRTIRYVQDGQTVVTEQEFTGRLEKYDSDSEIVFRYDDIGREEIWPQVEPVAGDPDFTVLYVHHFFAGNASCQGRGLILRYTIGGVDP